MAQFVREVVQPALGVPAIHAKAKTSSNQPVPHQYFVILGAWFLSLIWFEPRLLKLLDMSSGPLASAALIFFILFVNLAWLYGFFNIGVVAFAWIYKKWYANAGPPRAQMRGYEPEVAILYTTCNDFIEASAESCVQQDYDNYTVYLLDDSSGESYRNRIDRFAAKYPELVKVVRRPDRKGFKAGNLNHALAKVATKEKYFAIADADEIVPPNFLKDLVPVLEADPDCGFVQANHRSNPAQKSGLAKALGVGIDIHWKWYQPLRNRFGFVMFLGHGAVLRRHCWEVVGGFPEIVSEDLAYAIRVREHGWRGRFVEDVICYEDFPDTIRAFRIRHMKWTRGTCEFLWKEAGRLLRSPKITWAEKLDILFPTLNLPLTLFYFLFMIDANVLFPILFGVSKPITFVVKGHEFVMPMVTLHSGFEVIYTPDFLLITMMTFFAPVLCFLLELAKQPQFLFRFLCHSTSVYAALSPLSALGVTSFLVSGRATFLVTGDKKGAIHLRAPENKQRRFAQIPGQIRSFFGLSHPDQRAVRAFEFLTGLGLALTCIFLFQLSFLGLTLAFLLMPLMHSRSWDNFLIRKAVYVPFVLIITGISIGAVTLLGMQTTFFGFGFHF